ncbi:MAG: hypothetical protein JWR38_4107 [Mucilaginibacter sp.]|nr:hypothetical protein [Mucilaginibacter sp.]
MKKQMPIAFKLWTSIIIIKKTKKISLVYPGSFRGDNEAQV